ncbi:MAG: hypothetical protein JO020_24355 [Chloroflexi bacterium]|nr:hypothetical protein [Chloroflexota bacterium]MBV9131577.1 hypothetical protein [Chloroflexota bacterium]MBV9897308.1 hypothetical protein [Chloroflexota bacterium]
MGRSLKEALLGQYAALQEAGLAPTEVPQEDEAPLVVVESAPRGRATRPRRETVDRYLEADDLDQNGFDRDRRRGAPRREHRGDELGRERRRPPTGGGPRGRGRGREFEPEFAAPAAGGPQTDRPAGGPRGPRPAGPMGPRPARPGMGAPRLGGPPSGPGRPPSRTSMLQQRAEQRRRDDEDIAEMRQLLAEFSGQEVDDQFMETFSRGLAEETGALPPPHIVVDAIRESKSADPRKIGDAVRAHYRRPRPRPPMGPPPQPAVPAPA